ncbi:MAG TPA: DedA family protein [Solirubrobacteraceae bacterium]|nr:DedA family protein [Solirubrobacteraceae bacterium]
MFDVLADHVTGSPLTYLLIVAVCAGDALLPLFPAEVVVVTASVLAASGHLQIAIIVLAAILGAMIGDNCAYGLGRGGLRPLAERLFRSRAAQSRLEWARTQLEANGPWLIVVARFIPGGRTATTYAAGTLGMAWRTRFLPADATAGVLWSLYASGLGYLGGATFEHNLWLPLLIAAGASLVIALLGELLRRFVLDRRTRGQER